MFYTLSVDVLVFDGFAILLLQSEFNARKSRVFVIYSVTTDLGDVNAVGVIISRVNYRIALSSTVRIVRVGKRNLILLSFTNQAIEFFFDLATFEDLGGVELGLVLDSHLRVTVQRNGSAARVRAILEIGEADSYRIVLVLGGVAASLDLGITNLDRDSGRLAIRFKLGRHGFGKIIREGVLVGAVSVDVTRNGTGKQVVDIVVHLRVRSLIGILGCAERAPLCVVLYGLSHSGDLLLGSNGLIGTADNGENRRSEGIRVAPGDSIWVPDDTLSHEEPVAGIQTSEGATGARFALIRPFSDIGVLQCLGDLVEGRSGIELSSLVCT